MSLPPLEQLVRFDTDGWQVSRRSDTEVSWNLLAGGGVTLVHFPTPPDIPRDTSLDELRRQRRRAAQAGGGGLLEFDIVTAGAVRAMRSISKRPRDTRDSAAGGIYVASLVLPFESMSIVIKVECGEGGLTGERDAVVADEALSDGRVHVDDDDVMRGWIPQPDDGTEPLDANLAEAEKYDARFPDHPLSRVRAVLNRVQAELQIDPVILDEQPFPLPDLAIGTAETTTSLAAVARIVERFLFDYARVFAGHPVTLETYVDTVAAAKLRDAAEPVLATGDAMRPNFGSWGDMAVTEEPDRVIAEVEFEDRSIREDAAGDPVEAREQRMRMTVVVDLECTRVEDFWIEPVSRRA